MRNLVADLLWDETGATAIEYGLLVGLLAIVISAALSHLSAVLWSRLRLIGNAVT
jgi:Flp pilus assembly pilin Flp